MLSSKSYILIRIIQTLYHFLVKSESKKKLCERKVGKITFYIHNFSTLDPSLNVRETGNLCFNDAHSPLFTFDSVCSLECA